MNNSIEKNIPPTWKDRIRKYYGTCFKYQNDLEDLIRDQEKVISKEREEATNIEKKRAIIVMAEFVASKGGNYSLGSYLDMLIELDARKEAALETNKE